MPEIQKSVSQALYGEDIWDQFHPDKALVDHQGWNGNHPSLSRLAEAPGAKIVIDVGVWKGQSTINMAKSMKASGIDGCVIAVDTFLGSPEHWNNRDLYMRSAGHPNIYQIFMNNVVDAEVTDYVVPMPQTSVTAAIILQRRGLSAAVVHVDAAHEYEEALRDAQEYWKIIGPGGYLIGDDYHANWPGVIQAAGQFSADLRLPLIIDPPKWILQKPA